MIDRLQLLNETLHIIRNKRLYAFNQNDMTMILSKSRIANCQ